MKDSNPNEKYKDSLFRSIFKEPKYFVDVYKCVTGKTIKPEALTLCVIDSLVQNKSLKNDVSFLAEGGKLLIFVEHQSTLSGNMAIRGLCYYVELLMGYIQENKINLHSYRPVKLPAPEVYVVYNGKEKLKTDTIPLGLNIGSEENLKFKVAIKDINYGVLEDKRASNSLAGYSYFIQKTREYQSQGKELGEALECARKEALAQGYLDGYLNKKEVINMLGSIYTVEEEMEEIKQYGIEIGREEGREQGIEIGREEGIGIGHGIGLKTAQRIFVLNLLSGTNFPIEQIAKMSELTTGEVEAIIDSLEEDFSDNPDNEIE